MIQATLDRISCREFINLQPTFPGVLTVKHELQVAENGMQFMQTSPGDSVVALTTLRPLSSVNNPRSASVASKFYLCYKQVGPNYFVGWLPVYCFQDGATLEQAWAHTTTKWSEEGKREKRGTRVENKLLQWSGQELDELNEG